MTATVAEVPARELTHGMDIAALGRCVLRRRERRRMVRPELASDSGVPIRTIEAIEQGRREPRIGTLRRLCAALGYSLDQLVIDIDAEPAVDPSPRHRGRPRKWVDCDDP